MTVQFSTQVRNAMLDTIETAMGVSAKLQMFTGAPPANCAAAASGTKLIEITLAIDWAAAASAGAKALSSLPLATTALAPGGTIGHYRFVDSAGTTCHEQGTVTATGGGGDMIVNNPAVTSGQAVNVTAFAKTAPGA